MLTKLFEDIYAVHDLPIAYVKSFRTLLIADLHLGFEEEMAMKGITLPRIQLRKILEYIEKALRYVDNVHRLAIVGDVKHIFGKLGKIESKELREFFQFVSGIFSEVVLVRGNHDIFVYSIAKKFGVEVVDELWLGNVFVIHGHKQIPRDVYANIVIMAHEHPSIVLRDSIQTSLKLPCFLLVPLKRGYPALVLPACGVYQSGTAISTQNQVYLSPILRVEGVLEDAIPFAIVEGEGVYRLPRLRDLEELMYAFSL